MYEAGFAWIGKWFLATRIIKAMMGKK